MESESKLLDQPREPRSVGKHPKQPLAFGPAILVIAAFIGPGTILAASSAGAKFGFTLLWAVGFSVIATMVLQEMAGRLGIVTGHGLSHALRTTISNPLSRVLILVLVLLAIFVGNAAYQTGNILGAASGVMTLNGELAQLERGTNDTPSEKTETTNIGPKQVAENFSEAVSSLRDADSRWLSQNNVVSFIGLVAMVVIWIGRFDLLQAILTLLVALMSLLFIVAAIKSDPDWTAVLNGFIPRIPEKSELIVIGLIGTTVVPYNLFLHASATAQRWGNSSDDDSLGNGLKSAVVCSHWDTISAVVIGGLVTCAVLTTASVAFHSIDGPTAKLSSVKDVATQLEPALGPWAKTLFAIGLFSAGLTSAITAPIAAGYAASGCFGWSGRLSDWRLKVTATIVVLVGVVCAICFGASPKETIILAQAANGLLLPIVALLLLVMANRMDLMKNFKNGTTTNVLAVAVIAITALIAYKNFSYVVKEVPKLRKPASTAYQKSETNLGSPAVELDDSTANATD